MAALLVAALAGCGTAAGSAPGAYGTWLWNGSAWKQIASTAPGGQIFYWKDEGGLITWNGLRWNGSSWVRGGAALPGPPAGSDSLLPLTIFDEASNQLVNLASQSVAVWSGNDWKTMPVVWPESENLYGVGYDPADRGILMVMCCVGGGGQTWLWNGSSLVRLSSDAPIYPSAAYYYYLVPDGEGHIIAFGAQSQGDFVWDGRTWRSLLQDSTLTDVYIRGIVFDASQRHITAVMQSSSLAVDVWLWQNESWQLAQPAISPPGGCGVGSPVYDPELSGVVVTDSNQACIYGVT